MKKPLITVEVVSDVVCPWCYIGKRRMEKAVAQLSDQFDFAISYSPFELNPDIPEEGLNQKAYLSKKFGGDIQYDQITQRVTQTAAGEGLKFDFSKQAISPNTRNAHRVIQFAKEKGLQLSVKEAYMKSYFEEGIDLSKRGNLIAVAVKAGLDAKDVSSVLDSSEGLDEVKHAENLNVLRGVTGVPFYIINNKYGFSGAQPTDVFVNAFTEIGSMVIAGGEDGEVEKGSL